MPGHLKDTVRGKHFTGHRKDNTGCKKWPDKERGGANGERVRLSEWTSRVRPG